MIKNTVDDMKALHKFRTRIFYEENSIIYKEGSNGNHFYYIEEGLIKISTTTLKGTERILNIGYPGQFIGIQALNNNKHLTTAISMNNSVLYRFNFAEIMNLILDEPKYLSLITDMIKHNTSILIKNLYVDSMNAKQRLCFLILSYINDFESNRIALTINDFTKYTGLTRVRVYQILKKWEEKGVIVIKGKHFFVLRPEYIERHFENQ